MQSFLTTASFDVLNLGLGWLTWPSALQSNVAKGASRQADGNHISRKKFQVGW
jgi:hypothetical protein